LPQPVWCIANCPLPELLTRVVDEAVDSLLLSGARRADPRLALVAASA